ncbi:tripartite tricarboxylate transporter substrate binding protein [Muricoccus radiodurans]|uniref:tripartite tricarboxylate transporter substrate binding protein n=1 Tax=Muricoccus radiodurans TaxID=2231721 RepID=UPI003CF87FBD
MRWTRRSTAAALAAGLLRPAAAQDAGRFPDRPIRMVVPFAAGGAADLVARLVAQGMSDNLRQPVVVDNRGGSGGVIGSDLVAKAAPDGHTIVFHTLSSAVLNAALYRSMPFDTRRAFAPVSLVGTVPNLVVVGARFPARTLAEFLALLRANPGRHTYASSGAGTILHLSAHMLCTQAGVNATHVPYRGAGPALNDLVAGVVDFMVDTMPTDLPFVRDGTLRALAISTRARSPALPEVPTAAEAGLPGFETYNWHAVYGVAGTPPAILARLERAAREAVSSEALGGRLRELGVDTAGSTAAELERFWDEQIAQWVPVVRSSGATAE